LAKAIAELRGRKSGDQPTERASALAPARASAGVLSSFGAAVREGEVLDDDPPAPVCTRLADELRDRGAEPPVPPRGRKPRELDRQGEWRADRIPKRIDHPASEMAMIEVDREHRVRPELVQASESLFCGEAPAGVAIPPAAFGIEGEVVADSTRGCLRGDFIASVAELDRARESIAARGPIGEVLEGLW
jgi:hypothetical protein